MTYLIFSKEVYDRQNLTYRHEPERIPITEVSSISPGWDSFHLVVNLVNGLSKIAHLEIKTVEEKP